MKTPLVVLSIAAALAVGTGAGWLLPRSARVVPAAPAASAPAVVADVSAYRRTLSLATYNAHNLFDAFDNPYTSDEKTPAKKADDAARLAQAIRAVDADVLVLQEIEAGGPLKAFVREHLSGMGYDFVVDTVSEDPRGITVAAVSRVPVVRVVSHRLTRLDPAGPATSPANRFARDLLRVDVEPSPGHVISVYGVHFKSKRTSDESDDKRGERQRKAEAVRAREIMRADMGLGATGEAPGSARFVFLGDCNDTIDSEPMQILLKTTTPALHDVLGGLSGNARITFRNRFYQEGIDHILLSPELARAVVPESAKVFNGGTFEGASDHRPVRVVVRVP